MAAVSQPAGTATGTIAMVYGGGGTLFFDEGFPAAYLQNGFRVVQVRFATDWEAAPAGIKAAACRVATFQRWAFDGPHAASTASPFCAHQHSGGAGALGMTLAHYGVESFIDYAVVDAGPVFGRIDLGCAPGAGPTTRNLCPEIPAAPFTYQQASGLIDTWEETTTCLDANPPAADIAKWAADSVVSPGADYDYPDTLVHFWFCGNSPNEASGQGSFFVDEVLSEKSVSCVTGSCAVEPAWLDPAAKQSMIDTMTAECLPRHRP